MPHVFTANLHLPAQPFAHNPSAWRQRVPICLLAAIGAGISTYLALYQWNLVATVWDPIWGAEGSNRVLDSDVSRRMHRWFGMPDAALGALAYFGDAIYGLAGSTRRWQYRPWLVVLFGIDVIPLGLVSATLVVMQGAVVGHWCFLCLVTALISLVLIVFAADEVWATWVYLRCARTRSSDRFATWRLFWGGGAPRGVRESTGAADERRWPAPRGTMWPRVAEVGVGLWLMAGPLIFRASAGTASLGTLSLFAGFGAVVAALAATAPRLQPARLVNVALGATLAVYAYAAGPATSPIAQSVLIAGILLVMLGILPTDATWPPLPWREEAVDES